MTDALALFAAFWGVMMAIAPLLQIRRIIRRNSSDDVSLAYLAVLQVGFVLWVAYGIALANPALIIPNSVALLVGVATIVVTLRYRGGASTARASRAARTDGSRRANA
jgi:MtN3 and saliva related transmembrane protein